MRNLLTVLAIMIFGFSAQAADVVCSCKAPAKCSDIKISFVPSNPGMYMTIEYSYGDRNQEGFATITRDGKNENVVYQMGRFTLLEKNGKYSLPGRDAQCN